MRKTTKGKEKEVKGVPATTAKNALPATVDLFGDAGLGFEQADRDAYTIPFLVILQTNSPQCDEIDGARPGFFFNTATKEVYDGKEGVTVIPCAYQQKFIEWVPREKGGGYRGEHDKATIMAKGYTRDDSGRWVLPNGNYLADTHYHFCIILTKKGPRTVVMGLSSTQLKPSREWMTSMVNCKIRDKQGKDHPAPMMAILTKLTTTDKTNEKGKWKLLKTEVLRLIDTAKAEEVRWYLMAKEFHDQIMTGKVTAEEPSQEVYQQESGPESNGDLY